MVKIYVLSTCDTCRRALKWLRGREIAFEEIAIRETPPTEAELKQMAQAYDGELRRLFNTSGKDYREQNLGEKVAVMTETEAVQLLSSNGNLVKRPFLVDGSVALVGFDEAAWEKALG